LNVGMTSQRYTLVFGMSLWILRSVACFGR